MAYIIKHMAHTLATAKLLYLYCTLSHPYKHPSIVSSNAPISKWKAHQTESMAFRFRMFFWRLNVIAMLSEVPLQLLLKRLMNCIAKVHGSL